MSIKAKISGWFITNEEAAERVRKAREDYREARAEQKANKPERRIYGEGNRIAREMNELRTLALKDARARDALMEIEATQPRRTPNVTATPDMLS